MPPALSSSIFPASQSTHTTWWPTSAKHVPVTNPTYPVPMMLMFINPTLGSQGRRAVQSINRDSRVIVDRWFSPEQDSWSSIPTAAGLSPARWRDLEETRVRVGWFRPTPDDAPTTVRAGRRLLRPRPKQQRGGPIRRKPSEPGPGRLSFREAGLIRALLAMPPRTRHND